MKKCESCKKNVTKKCPGLICSRCEICVHDTTSCSALTAKQLTALRAADTLEWVCSTCRLSSTRRSSFYSADDIEEEEDEENRGVDIKKLVEKIMKEVHKTIERELETILKSVRFVSDKVDEFQVKLNVISDKMKELERKQTHLNNKNTHHETNKSALEQRIEALEQAQLTNCIEITAIPIQDKENTMKIVGEVGNLLQVIDEDTLKTDVRTVRRLPTRKGKTGAILVELLNEESKAQWLTAARAANIVVSNILPNVKAEAASERVYIREALTNRNKYLLSKAKQDLKNTYKFVWSKYGKVFARKTETDQIHKITSERDIAELVK